MPTLSDIASMRETPRNPAWGHISDFLNYLDKNALQQQFGYRNPVTGVISEALGIPAASRVANKLSYGEPISNIGKANVPLIPEDTAEAAMFASPIAGAYGKYGGKELLRLINNAHLYGEGKLANITPQPMRMTAWHGSPYKFTEFDPEKIGTGEGAQAYGHGLYVAQNKKVAEDYMKIEPTGPSVAPRRMLFSKEVETGTPEYKVAQLVDELGLSKARKFISDWSKNPSPDQIDYVNKASDIIQNITKKADVRNLGTGNMYKIDLPDEHINKMLDWDKPFSEQPKSVQEAFAKHDPDMYHPSGNDYSPEERGQWLYMRMAGNSTQKNASKKLAEMGIPGIKYLDEGSRGAKDGTRNFVVFPGNEHLLKIQDINGNPIK